MLNPIHASVIPQLSEFSEFNDSSTSFRENSTACIWTNLLKVIFSEQTC